MVSNQILQKCIEGIKQIAGTDLSVADVDGKVLATTNVGQSNYTTAVLEFTRSSADSQELQSAQFFKIYDDQNLEYILICNGTGENAHLIGKLAAHELSGLVEAYRERFDRDNFIKNLLLDNLLLVDIYGRAKRLRIDTDICRVAMIVNADKSKTSSLDLLKSKYDSDKSLMVTAVDENDVVIVKDIEDETTTDEIADSAREIAQYLSREGLRNVRVSFGTPVGAIKDVSRSYKEAKLAMDVGKIFFDDRTVIAYSALGIGRLIYQLPMPLCKMFIKEIFGGIDPDSFDEEMITTINKFFENNLNVSETSRQLFIHRNTLVYRLDKLQASTGLDLRVFEDAITFKISMMVVKYMKYMESFEY